jgi:GNAT superfamily N-acetyltransferase
MRTMTTIREATEADLPRLVELLYQLSQLGEIPEREVHQPSAGELDALRAIQADARCSLLVLEVEGKVVGTATLYVVPNLSHGGRPFAIVESVVVDEADRGLGFGRLLMDEAEARARAAGCYKIALTSNRRRAEAHRFYQRLGYRATHQGFTKYFDLLPPTR